MFSKTEYKHILVIGSGKNMEFEAVAVSWNPAVAAAVEALRRVSNPFDFYPDKETRIKMEYIKILASGTLTAIIQTTKNVFNLMKITELQEASKNKTPLDITLILSKWFGVKVKSVPIAGGRRVISQVKLPQAQILSVNSSKNGYTLKIDGSSQKRDGSIPW